MQLRELPALRVQVAQYACMIEKGREEIAKKTLWTVSFRSEFHMQNHSPSIQR